MSKIVRSGHHPVGFSRLGIASQCPAFRRESEGLADIPTPASRHGDLLHEAVAIRDPTLIPESRGSDRRAYDSYIEFVEGKIEEISGTRYREIGRQPELTLPLRDHSGTEISYGTLDLLVLLGVDATEPEEPIFCIIFEAKFGHQGVIRQPDTELQVRAQCLAALQEYQTAVAAWGFAHNPFGPTTWDVLIPRREANENLTQIHGIIKDTYSGTPSYTPGAACEYCPAAGRCQFAREFAVEEIREHLPGVVASDGDYHVTDGDRLLEFRALCRDRKKVLESILNEIDRAAIPAIERGEISGWRTQYKRRATIEPGGHEKARDYLAVHAPAVLGELDRQLRHFWGPKQLQDAYRAAVPSQSSTMAKKITRGYLEAAGCLQYKSDKKPTIIKQKERANE